MLKDSILLGVDSRGSVPLNEDEEKEKERVWVIKDDDFTKFKEIDCYDPANDEKTKVYITGAGNAKRLRKLCKLFENKQEKDINEIISTTQDFFKDQETNEDRMLQVYVCGFDQSKQTFVVKRLGEGLENNINYNQRADVGAIGSGAKYGYAELLHGYTTEDGAKQNIFRCLIRASLGDIHSGGELNVIQLQKDASHVVQKACVDMILKYYNFEENTILFFSEEPIECMNQEILWQCLPYELKKPISSLGGYGKLLKNNWKLFVAEFKNGNDYNNIWMMSKKIEKYCNWIKLKDHIGLYHVLVMVHPKKEVLSLVNADWLKERLDRVV